jgi:hypothetical protein
MLTLEVGHQNSKTEFERQSDGLEDQVSTNEWTLEDLPLTG